MIRTSSALISGSVATTANEASYAFTPPSAGAGHARGFAVPNAVPTAFTISAGSASAITRTVAFDGAYHAP